jgi:SnoaL-like domain
MNAEETVRAWNDCYVAHDIDGALSYMADDFQRFGDSNGWQPTGKQEWGTQMKGFMKSFPDWRWDMSSLYVINENLVICEFLEYGTWTEAFELAPGVALPATGQRYEDHNGDWIVLNGDGLISEIRAYITNNIERELKISEKITALMQGNA